MTSVEGTTNDAFRPSEGENGGVATEPAVKFNNSFDSEQTRVPAEGAEERVRSGSRDYSATDEWDASKVPPSRFQQRKGSVFATPPSRDGHVQRNRDNDAEFHEKHSKKFSFSKVKDKVVGATSDKEGHRRKSSSGSADGKK